MPVDTKPLDPKRVVASFDSASVLHASVVRALQRRPFPNLGNSTAAGTAIRIGGRLPWPVLRRLYTRIGASEGLPPEELGRVDMTAVANAFASAFPADRAFPGVLIGSSNGALAHLAAAMQIPWLPGTVLVPVQRRGDPDRPDLALEFGRRHAPALLDANPGIALHHMHDQAQDGLMVARMTYFRTKWLGLPEPYAAWLERGLAPGAPILLVEDASTWPVVRVGERHVFQDGGQGGLQPAQYLAMAHAPTPDDEAPEAEWGAPPSFGDAVRAWAAAHGHPVVPVRPDGPQALAGPVAELMRTWTRERGGTADRLIVPSFVLGDPWRTIELGRVPYWTFFAVRPAADALDAYLARAAPYRIADLLLFQHGVRSPGSVTPDDLGRIVRRHGATPRLLAIRESASPHDIGALGRYGPVMAREPDAGLPFVPLPVDIAAPALQGV